MGGGTVAKDQENYKSQVTMPVHVADRVRKLGEIIGVSESKMAALLLEAAVSDEAWFSNWMAAKVTQSLQVVKGAKGAKAKSAKS